jgi:NAD(P)-dependent dehydrogenase (short-subunit alcohol dehydrogenase family)
VVLVEGAGLFAFGTTKKDAVIAADIAEHTVRAKALAHACGGYEELGQPALFEMEYWSLEQAKLGKAAPLPLAGQVALVTGAGGAIGVGIAARIVAAGGNVVLADLDAARLGRALARLRRNAPLASASVVMDVTREESVRAGFAEACRLFGGVDIVVPNAGIAAVAGVDELTLEEWRRVQGVNLDGTFLVVREGARLLKRQGTGGSIVISASKNVFDPGARFGAYSASKAAAHQLGKVAALELAEHGIRVNMINADAVFGDEEFPSGLWEQVGPDRMRARGLDPAGLRAYYRDRNLLKLEVRAEHVGNAVVFFASCATPTTGATLPVDGGISGAFPR